MATCRYFDRGVTRTHLGKLVAPGVFFDLDPDDKNGAVICIHADADGQHAPLGRAAVALAELAPFTLPVGDPDPPKVVAAVAPVKRRK
jgi:hypothetical protein